MYDDSSSMKNFLSCMINVDHGLYHDPYQTAPVTQSTSMYHLVSFMYRSFLCYLWTGWGWPDQATDNSHPFYAIAAHSLTTWTIQQLNTNRLWATGNVCLYGGRARTSVLSTLMLNAEGKGKGISGIVGKELRGAVGLSKWAVWG